MNKYEIECKISNLRKYIENTIENIDDNLTWEEQRILGCIGGLADRLYSAENTVKYYSKEPKVGRLHLRSDGRYAIGDIYFTSGHGIEVSLYNPYKKEYVWYDGSVECRHTENGPIYYFLNSDGPNKDLQEGDLARVRL